MLSPLRLPLIQQVTSTLSHVLPGPSSYMSESELSSSEDESERRLEILRLFFSFLEAFLTLLATLVSFSICSDSWAKEAFEKFALFLFCLDLKLDSRLPSLSHFLQSLVVCVLALPPCLVHNSQTTVRRVRNK